MDGETHVSTNATVAKVQPYFTEAFVEYEVGEVIAIPAAKSVKYIQGVTIEETGQVIVPKGEPADQVERIIAHEVGHVTRLGPPNAFYRRYFGFLDDHSEAPGLMDPTGSEERFSEREKKILRGIMP
jgi:hypothetical protein